MPNILAQDIVNAAIQDSQSQTTNRTALYDYTDRIHQRILRESKWRFLLSDPKSFVTMPGVSAYTLISGSAPAGCFSTGLNLTDFNNIAPGSVYNLTTFSKMEEDADDATTLNYIINRDGSLRSGNPRTYANSLTNPGTIFVKPVPDNQNQYFPVPETPVVTISFPVGCTLPSRIYWGVVTYVDSLNGEGVQCTIPFTVAVPAGGVVTVASPNPVPGGGIAGNQAAYSSWNLYMGKAQNNYFLQNLVPIIIGTNWTEPTTGAFTGALPVPSTLNLPVNAQLGILNNGELIAVTGQGTLPVYNYALKDSNGALWEVIVSGNNIITQSVSPASYIKQVTSVFLTDTSGISTWQISVNTLGMLQSVVASTPPSQTLTSQNPPLTATIQPLNAYVIQFRYYKTRNQIVNPTDVLQIPYAYKDIVIAGVNYLANMYLDRAENREPSAKTIFWKKDFDEGMSQIRRDLRVSYRKTDYISPDVISQYVVANQQGIPTLGW